MPYSTTVGVDLAKNVIQVSVVSRRGRELLNRSLSRRKFAEFLGKQKPSLVAFESCASAHYWARTAQRHGHEARIIPAKAVAPFRQQAVHRSRELLIQESTALSNHLRGLLMEFGLVMPKGFASLFKTVPEILEDGDNELPDLYRPTLHRMY
jgi:transposase